MISAIGDENGPAVKVFTPWAGSNGTKDGSPSFGVTDIASRATGAGRWVLTSELDKNWKAVQICKTFPGNWGVSVVRDCISPNSCVVYMASVVGETAVSTVFRGYGESGHFMSSGTQEQGPPLRMRVDQMANHEWDSFDGGLETLASLFAGHLPLFSTQCLDDMLVSRDPLLLSPGFVYFFSVYTEQESTRQGAPNAATIGARFELRLYSLKFGYQLEKLGKLGLHPEPQINVLHDEVKVESGISRLGLAAIGIDEVAKSPISSDWSKIDATGLPAASPSSGGSFGLGDRKRVPDALLQNHRYTAAGKLSCPLDDCALYPPENMPLPSGKF